MPRTIEYHLRKVFTKLGIFSRAELVRMRLDGEPVPRPGHRVDGRDSQADLPMPTGGPLVDPRMRAHRPGPTFDMWEMWRRKEVTVDGTSDARGGRSPQRLDPVPNESSGLRGVGNGAAGARSR